MSFFICFVWLVQTEETQSGVHSTIWGRLNAAFVKIAVQYTEVSAKLQSKQGERFGKL